MEQTVKLTSDNQKAALNLTSPQTLSSSTNSLQKKTKYRWKKKEVTLLCLWPMSWQHGVVSESVHFWLWWQTCWTWELLDDV